MAANEQENPTLTALHAPVDKAQADLRAHVSAMEEWMTGVAGSTYLSEEGKADWIARKTAEEFVPGLERLRAAEASAIAQAEAQAEAAAMSPRRRATDLLTEKARAAKEGLTLMPAATLQGVLAQAVREKDSDTVEAVRRLALERAARGRLHDPNRSDRMEIDAETWPAVNVMERGLAEGVVYEPYADDPTEQEGLLANFRLLQELAVLDEAGLPENVKELRRIYRDRLHRRVPIDFGASPLADRLPLDKAGLLRAPHGRPGR
jgi:hypothetical protein